MGSLQSNLIGALAEIPVCRGKLFIIIYLKLIFSQNHLPSRVRPSISMRYFADSSEAKKLMLVFFLSDKFTEGFQYKIRR